MRFVAPPISDLRLKRCHHWAMLWLKWFVAFLDAAGTLGPLSNQAKAIGHRWLDFIERTIVSIMLLRATPRARVLLQRKGVAVHRRKESGAWRAFLGSALRKAFRHKELRQRIDALSQHIDALVARVLKRLPHGFTRRRPILARREPQAVIASDAFCALTVNTDTS